MPKTQGEGVSAFLNSVRATAGSSVQSTIPMATATNIVDVGLAVIKAPPLIRNEWMSNIWNKIGLTLQDYPVVSNHLAFLKKGTLEYGQTIEDIYYGLATAEPYWTGMADEDVKLNKYPDPFSVRKIPNRSAFYSTILSRQYTVTRHLTDIKKAFQSTAGVDEFLGALLNAITSREAYDDYRMTVALMARQIQEVQKIDGYAGNIHLITDFNKLNPDNVVTSENCFQNKDFLTYFSNVMKKWSNRMKYLRKDLNLAGVENLLPKQRQRIMMLDDIVTDFETYLLPWAFHNGNLEIGGVDGIDAWYSIGAENEATEGVIVTPEDIQVKATFSTDDGDSPCVAVIYDPEMVKIYNKERIASEQDNAKGNYWNMFDSLEDIYAQSPYRNFVCFMLD